MYWKDLEIVFDISLVTSKGVSEYDDETKKYITIEALHGYIDYKNQSNNKLTNIGIKTCTLDDFNRTE